MLIAHTCTQHTQLHPPKAHAPHVHVYSGPLVSSTSDHQVSFLRWTTRTTTCLTIISTHVTQCVRGVSIPPFSCLVSHYTDTHLYVFFFGSRFTSYNKQFLYYLHLYDFYFYKLIGKLTVFFANWGVHIVQSTSGQIHYHRTVFSSQIKSKIDNILTKTPLSIFRFTYKPIYWWDTCKSITSKSHTHPSHSQTSRLLTSSLSSGVPVPHTTQCMWDV
jgi:hypothetical protein